MEFRLLGPLEVEDDGKLIPLGGAKQRALFALLLLDRGRAVSTDRLVDEIWSGEPPQTAGKSIQVYVSGLRKQLGEGRIVTRDRGYELRVEPGEVDVDRFDDFVRTASGAPLAEASGLLREALALVRGRPLEDVSLEPWAATEVTRLEERILTAREVRIDADLALGRHRELVPELEDLVAEFPFRERFLEQLMLGLYRSSRQADALDAYRRGAARLRDELGLEPGRPLRDLEAAVLRHDPELDVEAPPEPSTGGAVPRSRRAWKLVVAGSLALVAAATAATVLAATHGDASLESLPPGVALVDSDTGHLRAQISEKEIAQPAEAVVGAGSLWVWSLEPYSLVRIDPATGEITARVSSPLSGDAGWYLPDGEDVWFAGLHDLARVNVAQGREVDSFHLTDSTGRFGLVGVARCVGSLWVADNEDNVVLRVNPTTGAVQARIPTLFPWPVACGDGGIWVGSNPVGLRRIDPRTNTIVASVHTQDQYVSIAVGGGFVWASDETKGVVYKVDENARVVATYETGDGARQVSFANGRLWVSNTDAGTVTGIDATSGEMRTYRFGHPLLGVAALGDALLVELADGLTWDDRIDSLPGDVAKILVPAYTFDPPDPALGTGWAPFMVERATCSMLLARLSSQSSRLEPDLAVAAPRVSADGRTYTFDVRSGVRFAPPSNAVVTADAVRYSVERALSSKLGDHSPGIGVLEDLEGAVAFHEGRARHVSGIRVRDSTISFTLTRRAPDFPERISLPYFCTFPTDTPIIHDGVQPIAPPSAGPFYMAEHNNGEYMILMRNPNYDGPQPALDAIGFREGILPEQAVARVDGGQADAVLATSEPLLAPTGPVANRPQGSTSRYEALHQLGGGLLALNASRPLFSDVRVRRAVSRAIDRAALASIWSETPSASLLRPGIAGYRPVPGVSLTGDEVTRLRPTRRARMGVPPDCDPCQRTFEAVRTALAPIGIEVAATTFDEAVAADLGEAGLDIVDGGFGLDYPDGASLLSRIVHTALPQQWRPAGLDAEIDRLDRMSGPARARAAARLALRLAVRDVPVVAYGYDSVGALVSHRLGCDDVEGAFDLTALCVATS
jgi:DNA-binding SARP family transcriptional activator/ABC-type transport system substrate-binding protein